MPEDSEEEEDEVEVVGLGSEEEEDSDAEDSEVCVLCEPRHRIDYQIWFGVVRRRTRARKRGWKWWGSGARMRNAYSACPYRR